MFYVIKARLKQGFRTAAFPDAPPSLPEKFQGLPVIDHGKCDKGCHVCRDVCPVSCVSRKGGATLVDMGACVFCGECARACPRKAIAFSREHSLATSKRSALETSGFNYKKAEPLKKELLRIFGRSLKLRQVSAGGCNACEADTNVLNTLAWDLGRFGIQFVASPRHADGILVTGPVTKNMGLALRKTYDAVPSPKIVIAVGACAISGGLFKGMPEAGNGLESILPVDLYIPGCPPHPATILDGLLGMLDRLPKRLENAGSGDSQQDCALEKEAQQKQGQ